MLTFEIHPELEARLERLAKKKRQTKDAFARRVVLDYLEDLEDLAIAEERWAEFIASGEKAIPLKEVLKKYGMEPRNSAKGPERSGRSRSARKEKNPPLPRRKAQAA